MNTARKPGNTEVSASTTPRHVRRKLSVACLALIGCTFAAAAPMAVPANLAASSMEGHVIVAFDSPAQRAPGDRYRVYCSAVGAKAPSGQADAAKSPAVVDGLAIGKAYDCRASSITAQGASNDSKPVRVRVLGAD